MPAVRNATAPTLGFHKNLCECGSPLLARYGTSPRRRKELSRSASSAAANRPAPASTSFCSIAASGRHRVARRADDAAAAASTRLEGARRPGPADEGDEASLPTGTFEARGFAVWFSRARRARHREASSCRRTATLARRGRRTRREPGCERWRSMPIDEPQVTQRNERASEAGVAVSWWTGSSTTLAGRSSAGLGDSRNGSTSARQGAPPDRRREDDRAGYWWSSPTWRCSMLLVDPARGRRGARSASTTRSVQPAASSGSYPRRALRAWGGSFSPLRLRSVARAFEQRGRRRPSAGAGPRRGGVRTECRRRNSVTSSSCGPYTEPTAARSRFPMH